MNPKKAKHYIKPTAEATGVSDKLVDDAVSFYWTAVRKALNEIGGPSITVANLGTFKIKPKVVDKLSEKYQSYINNLSAEDLTFQKHAIYEVAKHRFERLEVIKAELAAELQRKQEKKKEKEDYVANKRMEE